MEFRIRKASHDDVPGIIGAHRRSIREVCCRDYTEEQVAVWSGRDFEESIWCEAIDTEEVEIVVNSTEEVFGFCHHGFFSDEKPRYEVKGLYLCPEVLGRGLGSRLASNAITCGGGAECDEIILYSTKTARAFYEYKGFSVVAESVFEIEGVKLPCIEMSMNLGQ